MTSRPQNPKSSDHNGGVGVGNVTGGIHGSTFAGRDVYINKPSEQPPLYINVPDMPIPFVGREELVEEMAGRLLSGDYLALSAEGMPGVGKTTLAVALAHHKEVLHHFKDGVLWSGLGQHPDVSDVLSTWATALGIDISRLPNATVQAQAIKNSIGLRSLLLVIDDAWDTESALLLRCGGPNCCHLLTTRNQAIARTFAGAHQVEKVPVLQEQPAYELLLELAPEACEADPKTAQALVETVGHLPLAIELLGGYLAEPERSLFPELSQEAFSEMADPQQRLQLAQVRLGSHSNTEVTLRETIALSLGELPAETVRAFHALGAFAAKPKWFDQEAALFVTEMETKTLATLIARNLVEQVEKGRFALHQTIAEVARTQEPLAVAERHRDHYLERVNQDRENWRAIDDIYGQVRWAWTRLLTNTPDDQSLLDYFWALRTYQRLRGLWADYFDLAEHGLKVAQSQERLQDASTFFNEIGLGYSALGDKQQALAFYNQALPLRIQVGDRWGESVTRFNLAMVYQSLGELDEAEAQMLLVVEIDEASGHPDLESDSAVLADIQAQLRHSTA